MKQAIQSTPVGFSLAVTNRPRWFLFAGYLCVCMLPAIFARTSLHDLVLLILNDQTFSHIPFVPLVSAYFLFRDREEIFGAVKRRSRLPAAIALAGVAVIVLARVDPWHWGSAGDTSFLILGFVLVSIGAFGIFFGVEAMRAAYFPLLFLWFVIPIPSALLSETIGLLQRDSAAAVDAIFRLFHVPAVRQGFDFALPGLTVRIAEECSGIRSTLALLIAAVVAGHLLLRSFSRTLVLTLASIPISIAKNALRIAVLSWLAVYVDPRFLTGSIHHQYGGAIFFVVGLLMMGIVLILLQRSAPSLPSTARQAPRV